jgi:hypothetical protein
MLWYVLHLFEHLSFVCVLHKIHGLRKWKVFDLQWLRQNFTISEMPYLRLQCVFTSIVSVFYQYLRTCSMKLSKFVRQQIKCPYYIVIFYVLEWSQITVEALHRPVQPRCRHTHMYGVRGNLFVFNYRILVGMGAQKNRGSDKCKRMTPTYNNTLKRCYC